MFGQRRNTNNFYFSARLAAMLKGMLTARTTIISAPAGYGKTTAARVFFDKHLPKKAALHWLACAEEPASAAWERFCRVIQNIDPEAGNELLALGLPDEDTQSDVKTIFMEMEPAKNAEETWLVIDDFQNIKNTVPELIWNELVEHGVKNMHTVILTRTIEDVRMTLRPGVLHLTQKNLRLRESEIGEYFVQTDAKKTLTPDQIRELDQNTEGWIIALDLQKKNYIDTGSFLDTTDIHDMMREIVWDKLTEDERKFLLRVSPFDTYTLRQAAFMLGMEDEKKLPGYARVLSENNENKYYIQRIDGIGVTFRLHSTLLGLVRSVFEELPEGERLKILTRAGDWFAGNEKNQTEQAMRLYHRLGAFDKILSLNFLGMEFERMDKTSYADIMLETLENTTPEMKLTHPMSVIKIIFNLLGAGRYDEFSQWCAKMTALVGANLRVRPPLPEAEKKRLAGELALLTSFTKYNNIAEMGALMRRAHELLGERPSLISMKDAWTFGNPSVLFMYHAEAGRLDVELAEMDENCAHYFELTRGHGRGGNILMRAEALFNRGDVSAALKLAHEALHEAEQNKQECVCIGAELLLGRIAVFNGDSIVFDSVLGKRLHGYARQNPIKSNRMEADLAEAYLMQLIDRNQDSQNSQKIAEWIRKGDITEKRLFAMSIPYAQILFGKYLIQTGKPEIWLGMEGKALALAGMLRCRMAVIYGSILTAAAHQALGNTSEAAAALKTALDIALPDLLYMPFAENFSSLMLGSLLDEVCPTAALNEILSLAKKHEAGKAAILRKLYSPFPFGLTEREYQVARLAVQKNFTIPQIAEELFISFHTANGYMKNVYKKLHISSRPELNKKIKF